MNKCSTFVWTLPADYPGADSNDRALPIGEVLFKTHDHSTWMPDDHPMACSGLLRLGRLKDTYEAQGIRFIPWCVPGGTNLQSELMLARKVLSITNCLVFDVEPGAPFFEGDRTWAEKYLFSLRESFPDAHLGLCYDPRVGDGVEDKLKRIHFPVWASECDSLWPQCYFRPDFAGQGQWGRIAGCLYGAHDKAQGYPAAKEMHYVLRGDIDHWDLMAAVSLAYYLKGTFSIWRRGIVPMHNWACLSMLPPPVGGIEAAALRERIHRAKLSATEVVGCLCDGTESATELLKALEDS